MSVLWFTLLNLLALQCTESPRKSYSHYWKAVTIDGFISRALNSVRRAYHSKIWIPHEQHKYSITDSKQIGDTRMMLVNFPISTTIEISSFRLRLRINSANPNSADGFDVSLNYLSGHALIRKFAPSPPLDSAQTMALMDYILLRMGMQSATMYNTVRQRYTHRGTVKWITSIEVRCIVGKTTDWLSEFGYFNDNQDAIAVEMRTIHDLQIDYGPCYNKKSATLGPALLSIWIQASKQEFYDFYHQFRRLFFGLIALRGGHWTKSFNSTKPPTLQSIRIFSNLIHNGTGLMRAPGVKRNEEASVIKKTNPLDSKSRPDSSWSAVGPW